MTSFRIIIPTFEPEYADNPQLWARYAENFRAWGEGVVVADFASSEAFKHELRKLNYIWLVEGQEKLSSYDAMTLGLEAVEADIYVIAASDCAPTRPDWREPVMADFRDPDVVMSYATVSHDGIGVQNQRAPIDRPSEVLCFPRFCNLHVVALRGSFLDRFDRRIPNRWPDGGAEAGLLWLAEAVGGKVLLDYRFHVEHRQLHEAGRYNRTLAKHWTRSTRPAQDRDRKAVFGFLPIPEPRPEPKPIVRPLLAGWKDRGLYGLVRAAYICYRQTKPRFRIRRPSRARRQLAAFRALPKPDRMKLVQTLYYA